jgi:hypothetical protein
MDGNIASFKTTTPLTLDRLPDDGMMLIASLKDTICISELTLKYIEVGFLFLIF